MKSLSINWVTEGLIDFEYKKYILLDYLQSIGNDFNECKIYPALSSLVEQYNNLTQIKEHKTFLAEQFPKELSQIDFKKFRLQFEKIISDDKFITEISDIVDYALPEIHKYLNDGQDLYQLVEEKIDITPVGLIPINTEFGYLMLNENNSKKVRVYEYSISIFENANEKYRGIKTSFVKSFQRTISNTKPSNFFNRK